MYQATVEIDDVTESPDSSGEQNGEGLVSQILGISEAEVQSLANELGSVLDPILTAHGDKVFICARLGGAEMTLSQAVNTIWPHTVTGAMLIEGLPSVLAEIERILANPVEETEEVEEDEVEEKLDQADEKAEKEQPAKDKKTGDKDDAKVQKDQKKSKITDTEKQSKAEITETKPPQPSLSRTENAVLSKVSTQTEAKAVNAVNYANNVPEQLAPDFVEAETSVDFSSESINTIVPDDPSIAEVTPVNDTSGSSALELVVDKPGEIAEPGAPEEQGEEFFVSEIPNEELEPRDEAIELVEDEPEIYADEYRVDPDNFDEFIEEDLLVRNFEAGLEPDEQSFTGPSLEIYQDGFEPAEIIIPHFDNQPVSPAAEEVHRYEQLAKVSVEIEEVENTLLEVTHSLESGDPELIAEVDEILERIIEVPAKLEYQTDEIISDEQAQEELEELFTKLFDKVGIDYTPELIESLAYLTLKWHLVGEIEKLKTEEAIDEAPQSNGTHEIIKKILVTISKIRKALTQAYTIGQSALRLCDFSFAAGAA